MTGTYSILFIYLSLRLQQMYEFSSRFKIREELDELVKE